MQQAGQEARIAELLQEETPEGRNGWWMARERLGQTDGFAQDIEKAWEWAQKENQARIAQDGTVPYLGLEVQCLLMRASLRGVAVHLTPGLLSGLLDAGVWTPEQALLYAHRSWGA